MKKFEERQSAETQSLHLEKQAIRTLTSAELGLVGGGQPAQLTDIVITKKTDQSSPVLIPTLQ